MTTKTISEHALTVIDHYANLRLGGKQVAAPYHINSGHIKDLRVMVGKGTPEEIEMETKIWAQLKGHDLNSMTSEQIREFMQQRQIGLDCSGLVFHTLDYWLKQSSGKSLSSQIKIKNTSLLKRFKFWLRPAENIGADILTNELNATVVKLKDIQPGDLVRSKSASQKADHIMIITAVEYGSNGLPTSIKYSHSTKNFGKHNGMREGTIKVTNPHGELRDQDWQEVDVDGHKYTLEGFLYQYADNGIRRPNYWKLLQ